MPIPVSLLVLLFTFAEIAGFILVGQAVGIAATLALVLLAGIAGVAVLRRQSVATLVRVQVEMAAGRTPAAPVLDGALVGLGALLLILPGFLTDLLGLALLVPAARRALASRLLRRYAGGVGSHRRQASARVVELDRSDYLARPQGDGDWRPPTGSQPRTGSE